MANSLTASSPSYWSANMGIKFYKTVIFRAITDFSEESLIKGNGRIIDRPYRSDVVAENYTKGTALTAQDLTSTSDTLTLNLLYSMLMYTDDIDKLQNKYNTVKLWSEEAGQRLGVRLDGDVLYEVFSAASGNVFDAADLVGTAGEGISLATSNIQTIFGGITQILDDADIPDNERYFVVSPLFYNKLWQFIGGKESMLGDRTGETGNIGQYGGMKIFKSTNITTKARWTPADNPSNSATVAIQGITFTFVTSIGSTAGNVLIGSATADTIDNLVAFINGGGVSDTGPTLYVALSTANQRTVQNWVAYDGTTYFEIRVKGDTDLTLTSSDALDTWDAKFESQCLMAGRTLAVSAAIQTDPMVDVGMESTISAGKRGTNVMPLVVAGIKTFNVGTTELVRCEIRTDS